jgi:ATP-dependent Lon protease
MQIEASLIKGKGNLILTGKLGEVMQESAQAAYTYVKANQQFFNFEESLFRNFDLHLHVPEGAIPKDGPSAGITMGVVISSLFSKIPVRCDVAMTGEITLRGKVSSDRRAQGKTSRRASRRDKAYNHLRRTT